MQHDDEEDAERSTPGIPPAASEYKPMPLTPLSTRKHEHSSPSAKGAHARHAPSAMEAGGEACSSQPPTPLAGGEVSTLPEVNSDVSELSLPRNLSEADDMVEYDSGEDGLSCSGGGGSMCENGFATPSPRGRRLSGLEDADFAAASTGGTYLELQRENARLTAELIAKKLQLAEMSERELGMAREIATLRQVNKKLASKMAELVDWRCEHE